MKPDLSLYLVTDSEHCGDRGVLETVRIAIEGGVSAVQLRDKHATALELAQLALALLDVLKERQIPLIINDRLDVALATGADGVHLGQSDLDAHAARKIAGPRFIIGQTVSRTEEIERANILPIGTLDYLGIGPVFHTTTKIGARNALGPETVSLLRKTTRLPCIGIGGISIENAGLAWSTGLDGLAVVSAICAAPDPKSAAKAIRNART